MQIIPKPGYENFTQRLPVSFRVARPEVLPLHFFFFLALYDRDINEISLDRPYLYILEWAIKKTQYRGPGKIEVSFSRHTSNS